tara:strand:- start:542 stop:706 length:165 start_codon:yes stop_codon:yes gene_type:complete
MTYNRKTYKKCTFAKMGNNKIKRKQKGRNGMTMSEKKKVISDWKKNLWGYSNED